MNKGKKVKPIPENKPYSEILFSIINGNNYLQKICEDLSLNTSNTLKKIRYMEEEGYLRSHREGDKNVFPFEMKIYEINYSRLVEDFIQYVIERALKNYIESPEFPQVKKKLTPLLENIKKDMLSKREAIKEHLKYIIQKLTNKPTKIKGEEVPPTLLEPFFWLTWFIMDLAEDKKRAQIIETAKKEGDFEKLKPLIEIGDEIKNLKEEFTKQYEQTKEEWIKKKYGGMLNRFDKYETQFGTKQAWEMTFKGRKSSQNSVKATKPKEAKGKEVKEK